MTRKSPTLFLLLLMLMASWHLQAQHVSEKALKDSLKAEKSKLKKYREEPLWIDMMDDPKVNYQEAVKAFDEFWKDKPDPEEFMEGEHEEGEEERSLISRLLKSDRKLREEISKYAYDHKRFERWKFKNQSYVKEDGTVMTDEEKEEMIRQELLNRQNVSKSK